MTYKVFIITGMFNGSTRHQ